MNRHRCKLQKNRVLAWMGMATLAAIAYGCGASVSTKHEVSPAQKAVAKDASREELLEKYNAVAHSVNSINATVELRPTGGSRYSGVIEEYHEVKAFLLASRPSNIRMIGQAPLIGKTIFDMVSDGETFRVSIPTKSKFLVGQVSVERNSSKPLENLRPQHLLDALLWPEIRKGEVVLLEEFNDESSRYYVLTLLRGGYNTEILRKIWFDRTDLNMVRLETFGPKGVLVSDTHMSDWQPVVAEGAAPSGDPPSYPRNLRIDRPHDDYQLAMLITKLALNQDLPAERFKLEQPAGSELVRVGEDSPAKEPVKDSKP